jgi:hypothetical protein
LLKNETVIIKVRPMIPKNRKESAWKCLVRMEGDGAMGMENEQWKILGENPVVKGEQAAQHANMKLKMHPCR